MLLSLAIVLVTAMATTTFASAQAEPEFKLGFATLAQLIPDVVGRPLENERHDPATGNALQRTTTGMMVWRKATNTPAFTDGVRTWVLGPFGLQVRANSTRFDWEIPHETLPGIDESLSADVQFDVGTTRPLNVDAPLVPVVQRLRTVDGGEWLVRVAAENRVVVTSDVTPRDVLGAFIPGARLVIVSSRLDSASTEARAAVLAHELQHAADAAAGNLPNTPQACLDFEAQAFSRQSVVWTEFWPSGLPPATDPIIAELNDVAFTIGHNPQLFAAELARRYGADCGLVR